MNIEAFILVGGRSSRLGRDKAFVRLKGVSLARRSLDVINASRALGKATFVTRSEAQFGIEATSLGAPFIFDLIPDRGPLSGLHAALSYAMGPWIFLAACDYPFVSAELIDLLAGHVSDTANAVAAVQADGRVQPLCAFYRVAAAMPVVTEIIERPRVSPPMAEVLDRIGPHRVAFEEYANLPGADHFFLNVNTPADLETAVDLL